MIDPAQLLLLQEVGVLPLQRHSLHIIFRRVQQPGHTLRCLRLRELNAKIQVPELIVPEARDTVLPDNSRFAIVGKGQPDQFVLAAQAKGLDRPHPLDLIDQRAEGLRKFLNREIQQLITELQLAAICLSPAGLPEPVFQGPNQAITSMAGLSCGARVCGANRRSAIFSK